MKFITLLSLLFSLSAIGADTKVSEVRTAKPANHEKTQMDALIRGEMAAVKSYDTVMRDMKESAEKTRLETIRSDHQSAVDHLSMYVAGKPHLLKETESAGAWGTFANAWTKGAMLIGNGVALRALQNGEEHGIREYKQALKDSSLDNNLKTQIKSDIIPKLERHIETLKTFM